MSTKGSEKTTPMELVITLHDEMKKIQDKSYATTDDRSQTRFFNEFARDVGRETHDLFTVDFTESTSGYAKKYTEEFKIIKLPLDKKSSAKIEESLNNLNKDLTEDPKWGKFWIKFKSENQGLGDEDIKALQQKMLAAYRFKVISMVAKSNLDNASGIEKVNLAKLNSAIDSVSRDMGRNNLLEEKFSSVFAYQEIVAGEKFGIQLMSNPEVSVNKAIKKGIEMLKEGKSDEDIKLMIKKVKGEIVAELGKNENLKKAIPLAGTYGIEAAEKKLNEVFPDDKILAKIKNYQRVCDELGFDVDERLSYLEAIKNSDVSPLVGENQRKVNEYCVVLHNLAYIPKERLKNNADLDPEIKALREQELQLRSEVYNILNSKDMDENLVKSEKDVHSNLTRIDNALSALKKDKKMGKDEKLKQEGNLIAERKTWEAKQRNLPNLNEKFYALRKDIAPKETVGSQFEDVDIDSSVDEDRPQAGGYTLFDEDFVKEVESTKGKKPNVDWVKLSKSQKEALSKAFKDLPIEHAEQFYNHAVKDQAKEHVDFLIELNMLGKNPSKKQLDKIMEERVVEGPKNKGPVINIKSKLKDALIKDHSSIEKFNEAKTQVAQMLAFGSLKSFVYDQAKESQKAGKGLLSTLTSRATKFAEAAIQSVREVAPKKDKVQSTPEQEATAKGWAAEETSPRTDTSISPRDDTQSSNKNSESDSEMTEALEVANAAERLRKLAEQLPEETDEDMSEEAGHAQEIDLRDVEACKRGEPKKEQSKPTVIIGAGAAASAKTKHSTKWVSGKLSVDTPPTHQAPVPPTDQTSSSGRKPFSGKK